MHVPKGKKKKTLLDFVNDPNPKSAFAKYKKKRKKAKKKARSVSADKAKVGDYRTFEARLTEMEGAYNEMAAFLNGLNPDGPEFRYILPEGMTKVELLESLLRRHRNRVGNA